MCRYTIIFTTFLLIAVSTATTDNYRWTNEQGTTHLSEISLSNQRLQVVQLVNLSSVDKAQKKHSTFYPKPGSTDPGSVCRRKDQPEWIKFFCNFMTQELWNAAGRPKFQADLESAGWIPFFNLESKLLEGLIRKDKVETRYTPWTTDYPQLLTYYKI